jgi:hypothetical protein
VCYNKGMYTIPKLSADMFDWIAWLNGGYIHIKIGMHIREESISDCAELLRKYAIGYIQGDKPICRPKPDEIAVMFLIDNYFGWTHFRKSEFERVFKC